MQPSANISRMLWVGSIREQSYSALQSQRPPPKDSVSYFAVVAIRNQNLCAPSGHLHHVADNVSTAVIARLRGGLRGTYPQVQDHLDPSRHTSNRSFTPRPSPQP